MLFRSIKALNVRPNTIKLFEENIGKTLFDINHSKIFLDTPPRITEIKTKINKWDLMKLKSFCTAKETINKTKNKLKMDSRPKCKTGQYKTLRGKHRKNTLCHKSQHDLF